MSLFVSCAAVFTTVLVLRAADTPEIQNTVSDKNKHFFEEKANPFFSTYCVKCHNDRKSRADFRIDNINDRMAQDAVRWEKALEMISLGDMPPKDSKQQPTKIERDEIVAWINAQLKKIGRGKHDEALNHPAHGNRIDHGELFNGEHKGPSSSPPRIWRISPYIYSELFSFDGSDATLEVVDGHGFKDYASLKTDEAAVNVMLQSAEVVAAYMIGEQKTLKRKSPHGGHKSRLEHRPNHYLKQFVELAQPTEEQYEKAVDVAFEAVFGRPADEIQRTRYLALLRDMSDDINHRMGITTMLKAMMLSPEFIYRMEIGMGEQLPDGRRMLSPMELAYAIGFAIFDTGPDNELLKAAEEGRLTTRNDVEREVRRLLAAKEDLRNRLYSMEHRWWEFKPKKGRLLRFFREYFAYERAVDVFKDDTRKHEHWPMYLVRDADQLVMYAIEQDERVLEFLLTTDQYFVSYHGLPEAYHEWLANMRAKDPEKDRFSRHVQDQEQIGIVQPPRLQTKHIGAYNLPFRAWNYEAYQPFKQPVPRAGILTHPAWLVAHSGNFDNDIVRRGKWIREHLLADVVPDLPIGVDAQLSTDPTLTLREKFELKVYNDACWRCHKKMNPLGNAFEMYDDFGRFRTEHHFDYEGKLVGSPRELHHLQHQASHKHNAGKPEFMTTTKPVITNGKLDGTDNPNLDGDVENAVDLMHRLAKSNRVRQSFIRHAFRYWMGRNETLDDSPTLIAADKAYIESNGSFNELLVSLLTSDSFIYRK